MIARDIMSQPVVTVCPETEVPDIAKLLVQHGISGVVVVDDAGHPVGVVSASDLLYRVAHPNLPPHIELLGSIIYLEAPSQSEARVQKVAGLTAAQLMTGHPVTVKDNTPIADVADALMNRKVHRVPVLHDGKLVGLITRGDVVRHTLASEWSP
ncbi:MAG: CBS domain-containing protein [Candidatus Xenobia bacterium]